MPHTIVGSVQRLVHDARSDGYDRVIADQRAADARVLKEAAAREKPCQHTRFVVLWSYGSSLDDHETSYGYCKDCHDYRVLTAFVSGRLEDRAMTASEVVRAKAVEGEDAEW